MAFSLATAMNTHVDDVEVTFYHCENSERGKGTLGLKRPFSRYLNAALSRLGGSFAVLDCGVANRLIELTADADVLHVHNLHGYYLNFEKLLNAWCNRPIVWTWHDMWGATGRCGFCYECDLWRTGCLSCPSLDVYPRSIIDQARSEFIEKSKLFFSIDNLTIVSPSSWLGDIAVQRGFNKDRVKVIPNPVNADSYRMISKDEARDSLGLPADKFIPLFIASNCGDKRKGYADFANAVDEINWFPVAVGSPPSQLAGHILHAGTTSDASMLNAYYCAADVMVIPTYADNYPNTVVESLVCGTPVVGYDEGGVPSQLEDMDGCHIVEKGDQEALKAAVRFAATAPLTLLEKEVLSQKAFSRWAQKKIVWEYVRVYRGLIR